MAIIGNLSIVASNGETLTASNDLALAWKWAEVEANANGSSTSWADYSYARQCATVADALAALREAYGN